MPLPGESNDKPTAEAYIFLGTFPTTSKSTLCSSVSWLLTLGVVCCSLARPFVALEAEGLASMQSSWGSGGLSDFRCAKLEAAILA